MSAASDPAGGWCVRKRAGKGPSVIWHLLRRVISSIRKTRSPSRPNSGLSGPPGMPVWAAISAFTPTPLDPPSILKTSSAAILMDRLGDRVPSLAKNILIYWVLRWRLTFFAICFSLVAEMISDKTVISQRSSGISHLQAARVCVISPHCDDF
ncbi:hypothetical protein CEXT_314231 [Caerostris extrusa]|uniref:Uncharacterized protein n=1 Tax=Caerostris extrusa TaxID=172846 RepID=A0AAV4XFS8_CAEEX|nr:hypothetical protein CEXT_314231 [Caerostris extrusa]